MMGKADLVVEGVSTGDPNCLAAVIPLLPKNLGAPVLLVQHMPPIFTKSMAMHLDGKSKIGVMEAQDNQLIEPGQVLIAPGGQHLEIKKEGLGFKVHLTDAPAVNSCRPAVDVLFRSVARFAADKNILALVLTGMGADGCKGVELIRSLCTAKVIVQDEESAVVWGMPGAVFNAGLADEVLPQAKIAARIAELT